MRLMRFYCTLFDRSYLARGLSLYSSLIRHSSHPFVLYILCLDNETFRVLHELDLPSMTLVPLAVVEHNLNLSPVRTDRTWREYCWTLASQFMSHLMSLWSMDLLTYLDSDLFFFSDPEMVFAEIGSKSIAIVPHRFAPRTPERITQNGVFNVGWVTFRLDEAGLKCLNTWAQQCRDWCYHRNEEGKFADQGYLDVWPAMYKGTLHVIENIGVGLAPWNIQQYDVVLNDESQLLCGKREGYRQVVFYHFHEFEHDGDEITRLTRWPLPPNAKELIYAPYIHEIKNANRLILSALSRLDEQAMSAQQQGERA